MDGNFTRKTTSSSQKRFSIELDMLTRFNKLQRKLQVLKLNRKKRELSEMKSIPTINSNSRRIANQLSKNRIYSPTRTERTQEILKNSRFMPKKVKISLHDLDSPDRPPQLSSTRFSAQNLSIFSPRSEESPTFYPSLMRPSKNSSSRLPSDISLRNELLFSLRDEISSRGFQQEPEEPPCGGLPIHLRSANWLRKKQQKLEKVRALSEKRELSSCSFRPKLASRKNHSLSKRNSNAATPQSALSARSYTDLFVKKIKFSELSRNGSESKVTINKVGEKNLKECYLTIGQYSKISPIKMNIGYISGFSKALLKKSRPMLDYSKIEIKS